MLTSVKQQAAFVSWVLQWFGLGYVNRCYNPRQLVRYFKTNSKSPGLMALRPGMG